MYFCWWLVALAFVIFLAPAAVRLITGSSNPEVIANGVVVFTDRNPDDSRPWLSWSSCEISFRGCAGRECRFSAAAWS